LKIAITRFASSCNCINTPKGYDTKVAAYIAQLTGLPFRTADKHHTSVDHIDNDPLNNKPENLRWATPKMQADNTHSKAIVAYNKDGSEAGRWVSAADAARELGGASTNISACLRGKTKTCRGFTWKYQ
jgi:hypothetical protein